MLDPINKLQIEHSLRAGIKVFTGGNCTVSLMLMACHGLFFYDLVEWVNSETSQAASGAGAKHMIELVDQISHIARYAPMLDNAIILEESIRRIMQEEDYPRDRFGVSLANSLIPWIDGKAENGQSKEEWKGSAETNKILGREGFDQIMVDGTCVRAGVLRCHSQAILIKLKENMPVEDIESIIAKANPWVKVIPNDKESTVRRLSPEAVSGKLDIHVGRIRKARLGETYLRLFTVGDQLLWGAAEPLRRALDIIIAKLQS